MALLTFEMPLVDLSGVKQSVEARYARMDAGQHEAKVLAIVNGKGGVGKSSTAAAFAHALSKLDYDVLLAELDEQGNNCEDLGISNSAMNDRGAAQAAAILEGKPLTPTGEARPGLHVVPGGELLEEVVEELYVQRRAAKAMQDPDDKTAWMSTYAAAIDGVRDDYDLIILDVAPGSEVLQLAALVAADYVLIPSKSDPSSRKGLRAVAKRFAMARDINDALQLLGVVLFATNSSATKVQEKIKANLEEDLAGTAPLFEQTIRHVEAAAVEARLRGRVPQELRNARDLAPPLLKSMKALATDYQSLTTEILQEMAKLRKKAGEVE
ncbi:MULTISPECIES: ParA family protein [Streptomyces]|uniref:ParA family protein n=1 Tax=Streptomyces TaxID=1883 RepID=UPI001B31B38B|nr:MULTISPECIES: ParA family protein [Streptomyces]MBP5896385.1 ParA family protein [Streptomyces sp. LBUM 1481]MBP5926761.1 ParA family protein [Streptomyces sp. LBUM 1483]MDX3298593.1 ParA family protein [Streptomyces scabiei]MDX3672788.1 ParA family protein [Streptomyces europaeiscabiei]